MPRFEISGINIDSVEVDATSIDQALKCRWPNISGRSQYHIVGDPISPDMRAYQHDTTKEIAYVKRVNKPKVAPEVRMSSSGQRLLPEIQSIFERFAPEYVLEAVRTELFRRFKEGARPEYYMAGCSVQQALVSICEVLPGYEHELKNGEKGLFSPR